MAAKSAAGTLRLISLNVAGGKYLDRLGRFAKRIGASADIICLQEVVGIRGRRARYFDTSTYEVIESSLRGHVPYSSPPYSVNGQFLSIFVRKGIRVRRSGSIILAERRRHVQWARMLYAELEVGKRGAMVCTLHGLYIPHLPHRLRYRDTKRRILQSERVASFLKGLDVPSVLCGDFNLESSTRSISIVESGRRNLMRGSGIKSTRDSFARPDAWKLTDYMFASEGIRVRDFRVLKDKVSDHLPLSLRFSVG